MKRIVKMWIVVVAAGMSVAGCANGSNSLTSPSPLAVATPSTPSSCAVPGVPANVTADVTGARVGLSWSAVGDAADYVVIVGWSPTTSETLLTNTTDAHHSIDNVPSGTHFARVHAHNWCGTSHASAPITFSVN